MRSLSWYRRLLEVLPEEFRRRHGREMEWMVRERLAGRRGALGRFATALRAVMDVMIARCVLTRDGRPPPAGGSGKGVFVDTLWFDVKIALRSLFRRRGLVILGAATLALGIGAATAVFSVVNGVLLRPLPYRDADRIGIVWHDLGRGAQSLPALNFLDYLDYRERSELFEDWTIATGRTLVLGKEDRPQLVDVGLVAANFFSFFGFEPALGRDFEPEEDVAAGANVCVLSHRLWQGRFGGDQGVLGRIVHLQGESYEVVGVLPAGFRLLLPAEAFRLRDADLYRPVQLDLDDARPRNFTGHTVFGRLRRGASWQQAQDEMERLEARLKEEHVVHAAADLQVRVVPLQRDVTKGARTSLWVLLAAVALVLLVACGNLSQLLMVRWRGGTRELALRSALGASRTRLIRMVLLESMLLAAAGGVLGLGLGRLGVELVRRFAAESVPRLEEVSIDPVVVVVALAAAFLSALLFSLLPIRWFARAPLTAVLNEASRGSSSLRQARSRDTLITVEVALSVVLLVATGLLIRSFLALQAVEPGFDPNRRLTLRVSLPVTDETERDEIVASTDSLLRRLRSLPGVRSVAFTSQLPLTGSGPMQPFAYDEETARNWESVTADHRWVTPGYFEALGAVLVEGRDFVADDLHREHEVIVIDELLAERAFAGVSPVGRQLQVEPNGSDEPYAEVVGVVRHVRLHDLARSVYPEIFSPLVTWQSFDVVLHAAGDPSSLVEPVRRTVRDLHGEAAVDRVQPMDRLVSGALAQARLSLVLMSLFGALTLALAAIGLFGVISYAVRQRTVELGIRIALGASPEGIRRLVLGRGGGLVLAGALLGLLGAALTSRSLSGLLFGVSPLDLPTYLAVTLLLAAVSLLACWMPARRATRLDPVQVLKAE